MPKYQGKYDLSGYGEITITNENSVVTLAVPTDEYGYTEPVAVEFWNDSVAEWREFIRVAQGVANEDDAFLVGIKPTVDADVGPFIPATSASPNSTYTEVAIRSFLTAKVPVVIEYAKEGGERVVRTISPWEIKGISDGSGLAPPKYVKAYDHFREEVRNFRIARIKGYRPAMSDYRGPDA